MRWSPKASTARRLALWLNGAGGCDFPARPDLSALAQSVLWSPAVDPAVLTLAADSEPGSEPSTPPPDIRACRNGPEGTYAFYENTVLTQLVLRHDADPDGPLVVLVPFDADTLGRIEALTRFWRAWQHQPVPPDTRITAQRRRRLRLVLRAADGRDSGASYREIAIALYGGPRVDADPWKTSPLRDTVIGLVESAASLIAGGYLQLLRHRRRR